MDGVSAILADVRVRNSIAEPTWSLLVSPGPEQRLRFCRSTEVSVGAGPLVPDPYEERTVEVRTSGVGGGGEGLYVKRNIVKGELIAMYNGVRTRMYMCSFGPYDFSDSPGRIPFPFLGLTFRAFNKVYYT